MENQKDYSNGDHSFKQWFKLMWKEFYFQLFVAGLAVLIGGIVIGAWLLKIIGLLVCTVIGYKGLYQRWQDFINGRSR